MNAFLSNIKEIDIESTSICNAACPQCVREYIPGDHSWFTQDYLTVDFFNERIPDYVYKNLKNFNFSGSIGDPCAAPNFLDVIKTIRTKGNFNITINTNGGMKSPEWWEELATVLYPTDAVQFGIDGLEDTNHIYRVNVNWKKLTQNFQAFIKAGGRAYWQYIAFKHNQHQVEDARKFAADNNFALFFVRPSHRFAVDQLFNVTRIGSNGVIIEPPDASELIHDVVKQDIPNSIATWMDLSKNTCINCYAKKTESVYIDHAGRLLPCCYIGGYSYARKAINFPDKWNDLWNEYGNEHVSLYNHTWEEVLESEFFHRIEKSWGDDYDNGRMFICSATCSSFNGSMNKV